MNYGEIQASLREGTAASEIVRALQDIRERIEIFHTSEFSNFLHNLFNCLRDILIRFPAQFIDNDENKCRHTVLDIFSRFPTGDILRSYIQELLKLTMKVANDDNEDNALVSLRIIFELHKAYRNHEDQVMPFIRLVQQFYHNVPNSTKSVFSNSFQTQLQQNQSSQGIGHHAYNLVVATNSQPQLSSRVHSSSAYGAIPTQTGGGQGSTVVSVIGQNQGDQTASVIAGARSLQEAGGGVTALNPVASSHGQVLQGGGSGLTSSSAGSGSGQQLQLSGKAQPQSQSMLSGVTLPQGRLAPSASTPVLPVAQGATAASSGLMVPLGPTSSSTSSSAPVAVSSALSVGSTTGATPSSAGIMMGAQGQPATSSLTGGSVGPGGAMSMSLGQQRPGQGNPPSFASLQSLGLPASTGPSSSGAVGVPTSLQATTPSSLPTSTGPPSSSQLMRATDSFRVLTECPLIVMLLFQLYAKYIKQSVPQLVPYMMEFLGNMPPYTAAKGQRERYKEFIAAQVKTLSFLTYLLRGFADLMAAHEDSITKNVLSLLQFCPGEAVSTRKELLVSIRHILATDFRKGFQAHIDRFLDERLLLGPGKAARESLKPLAHSALADLVAHARDSLSSDQATRVVYIFSKNVQDPELPLSLQTTSVRLLLNLVERLKNHLQEQDGDAAYARQLLHIIMRSLIAKFSTLRIVIPQVEEAEELMALDAVMVEAGAGNALVKVVDRLLAEGTSPAPSSQSSGRDRERPDGLEGASDSAAGAAPTKDTEKDNRVVSLASSSVAKSVTSALFRSSHPPTPDQLKDLRQLIKISVVGIQKIVFYLTNSRLRTKDAAVSATVSSSAAVGRNRGLLSEVEIELLSNYFEWGLEVLKLLLTNHSSEKDFTSSISTPSTKTQKTAGTINSTGVPVMSEADAKELIENFSGAFTVMDPDLLRVVVAPHLHSYLALAVTHPLFLNISLYLITNGLTSPVMVDILLTHLVNRMEDLLHPITNIQSGQAAYSSSGASSMTVSTTPSTGSSSRTQSESGSATSAKAKNLSAAAYSRGQRSSTLLRMFKMIFNSVNSFAENEKILRPRLQGLVLQCLRLAHEARVSVNYLLVLRTLFRAVSSGKFENTYREMTPLLPAIINGLCKLLDRTEHPTVQNIILELCLTLPARLSSLLPHLQVLLQLLVKALRARGDLPSLALRTLEFWVENLQLDFLSTWQIPALHRDIMIAVCSHLRPAPYPYGMLALRVLGKLGGRNRRFLRDPIPIGGSVFRSHGGASDLEIVLPEFRPSPSSDETSSLSIKINYVIYGACSVLEKLTTPAPVESEISSLHSSYPEMPEPPSPIEVADACPASLDVDSKWNEEFGSLCSAVFRQKKELLGAKPSSSGGHHYANCEAFIHCAEDWSESESQSDDDGALNSQTPLLMQSLLTKEMSYLSGKTCLDHKRGALNLLSTCIAFLLDVDLHSHEDYVEVRVLVDNLSEESRYNCLLHAISAIAMASVDPSLRDEARNCLRGLCFYFADICSRIGLEDKEASHQLSQPDGSTRAPTPRTIYILNDVILGLSGDLRPNVYRNGCLWLLHEWMTAFDAIRTQKQRSGGQTTPLNRSDEKAKPTLTCDDADGVVKDLARQAACACQAITWRERLTGVRIIHDLCLLLPRRWCLREEETIIHALFSALRYNTSELAVVATDDVFSCLGRVIKSCHYTDYVQPSEPSEILTSENQGSSTKLPSGHNKESGETIMDLGAKTEVREEIRPKEDVLEALARAVFDPSGIVRLAAKVCLRMMSAFTGQRIVSLLQPAMPWISSLIKSHSSVLFPSPEGVGLISGLAYSLSARSATDSSTTGGDWEAKSYSVGAAVTVSDDVVSLLEKVLSLTEAAVIPSDPLRGTRSTVKDPGSIVDNQHFNEDFLLMVSFFPAEIPSAVDLRLHTIRFIHAAVVHPSGVLLSPEFEALRKRCYLLLFKSLSVQWEEIIVEGQRALTAVVSHVKTAPEAKFPKDVMTECLKPMLNVLQDRKRLNVSILLGLQLMLRLVTSRPFFHLGDKFLEHLKHWYDPEAVMALSIWNPGDELRVASSLMNLFHLLPRMTSAAATASPSLEIETTPANAPSRLQDFLPNIVSTTIRLESVRYLFRHQIHHESPYIGPLCRFLAKYSSESVAYFMDSKQLCKPQIGQLLLRIASNELPSRNLFLEKLVSNEQEGGIEILIKGVLEPAIGPTQEEEIVCGFLIRQQVIEVLHLRQGGKDDTIEADRDRVNPGDVGKASATLITGDAEAAPCAEEPQLQTREEPPTAEPDNLLSAQDSASSVAPVAVVEGEGEGEAAQASSSSPDQAAMHHSDRDDSGETRFTSPSPELQGRQQQQVVPQQQQQDISPSVLSQQSFLDPQSTFPGRVVREGPNPQPVLRTTPLEIQTATLHGLRLLLNLMTPLQTDDAEPLPCRLVLRERPRLFVYLRLLWNKVLLRRQVPYRGDEALDNIQYQNMSNCVNINARTPSELLQLYDLDEEAKVLCQILIRHCSQSPGEAEALLDLLPILYSSNTIDFTFLVEYCRTEIPKTYSVEHKRNILTSFFSALFSNSSSDTTSYLGNDPKANVAMEIKVKGLEIVVTPLLLYEFQQERSASGVAAQESVLDADLIKLIMKAALGTSPSSSSSSAADVGGDITAPSALSTGGTAQPPSSSAGQQAAGVGDNSKGSNGSGHALFDSLRVELLKLATLLIEHLGLRLVDHRKDLIRFAWNQIKAEDVNTKHWAYVNVCRFIAVYDTPPKIILQVFVALLRSCQPECKELVRLALDCLVPSLPKRLRQDDFIKALKWAKKIMLEEGHVVAQMSHIWSLLARHAELFYSYRSHFVPQMINSLTKLGLSSTCTLEVRQTAVGVADAVLGWELLRFQRKSIRLAKAKTADSISSQAFVAGLSTGQVKVEEGGHYSSMPSLKRERDDDGSDTFESNRKSLKTEPDATASKATVSVVSALQSQSTNSGMSSTASASMGSGSFVGYNSAAVSLQTPVPPVTPVTVQLSTPTSLPTPLPTVSNPSHAVHQSSNQITEREDEFGLNGPMIQILANFLVRLGLQAADTNDSSVRRLLGRCVTLCQRMCALHPVVRVVKFMPHLERLVQQSIQTKTSDEKMKDALHPNSHSQSALATLSNRVLAALTTFLAILFNNIAAGDSDHSSQSYMQGHMIMLNNISMVRELLQPMMCSSSSRVQRLSRILLSKVVSVFPPDVAQLNASQDEGARGLYPRLKDLIEKGLRGGPGSGQVGASESADLSATHASISKITPSEKPALWTTIQLLEEVCNKYPPWVKNHGSALVTVAKKLVTEHLQQATLSGRSSAQNSSIIVAASLHEHGQDVDASQVMATPDVAMLEEFSVNNVDASTPVTSLPESISCLTVLLVILCRGLHLGHLDEFKPAITGILGSILEGAESPVVIATALDYCCLWTSAIERTSAVAGEAHTSNSSSSDTSLRSPLSLNDQLELLSKIGSLDKLPESSAQPLVLRMAVLGRRLSMLKRKQSALLNSDRSISSSRGASEGGREARKSVGQGTSSKYPNKSDKSNDKKVLAIQATTLPAHGSGLGADSTLTASKDAQESLLQKSHGLEEIGILSVKEEIRSECFSRLMKEWAGGVIAARDPPRHSDLPRHASLASCIINMFEGDLNVFTSRHWSILILPRLLLSDVTVEQTMSLRHHTSSSTSNSASKGHLSGIPVQNTHPYAKFCDNMFNLRKSTALFISSLVKVCAVVPATGEAVIRSLMSQIWSTLTPEQRELMTVSITRNIARHHYRQVLCWPASYAASYSGMDTAVSHLLYCGSWSEKESFLRQSLGMTSFQKSLNVPQALVETLLKLEPKPNLSVEFLAAVGNAYSSWSEVVNGFEDKAFCASIDSADETVPSEPGVATVADAVDVLLYMLMESHDYDSVYGLAQICSTGNETVDSLALERYGMLLASQKMLVDTIRSHNGTNMSQISESLSATGAKTSLGNIYSLELDIWENRWVETAKQLSQWSVLADYSNNLQIADLSAEVAAVRLDWETLRKFRSTPTVLTKLSRGDTPYKLLEVMLAVVENRLPEADRLCAQAAQMALLNWQLLPPLQGSSRPHRDMFHLFHRIIELRESAGIIGETTKSVRDHNLPDLKGILSTWRDRLPEEWEGLSFWDTLLQWRVHIFQSIQNMCTATTSGAGGGVTPSMISSDNPQLAALNDSPWTIITLARVARKQSLVDISLSSLSRLHSVSRMDVIDAYHKLREQILACLATPGEYYGGLNIINSTNLEYFNAEQRAELFRLKGLFQERLGLSSDSHQSYSQSVQIYAKHRKGWLSWADFCYEAFRQKTASGPDTSSQISIDGSMNVTESALSSIICVFKAADCGCERAKALFPRVLLTVAKLCAMTSVEGEGGFESHLSRVGSVLRTFGTLIPEWLWLPLVPQLLGGLDRAEGPYLKFILERIAKKYPSALILPLVSGFDNPREIITASLSSSHSTATAEARIEPNLSYRRDLLLELYQRCPLQCVRAISLCERILELVEPSLLERCFSVLASLLFSMVDDNTDSQLDQPPSQALISALNAFGTDPGGRALVRRRQVEDKEESFVISELSEAYSVDALETKSLREVLTFTAAWIDRLGSICESSLRRENEGRGDSSTATRMMPELFIGRCSTACQLVHQLPDVPGPSVTYPSIVGLPGEQEFNLPEALGQYAGLRTREPKAEHNSRIVRILPVVRLVNSNGKISRRIRVLVSDGSVQTFTASCQMSAESLSARAEEAFNAIADSIDWSLTRQHECRKRDLFLKQPFVSSIAPGVQLYHECCPEACHSLWDVMSDHLSQNRSPSDAVGGTEVVRSGYDLLVRSRVVLEESLKSVSAGEAMEVQGEDRALARSENAAYLDSCELVPADLLKKVLRAHSPSQSVERSVRRLTAYQYGIQLALQLLFKFASNLSATRLHFSISDGRVYARDVVLQNLCEAKGSSNGSVAENPAFELRVTRCIVELLGELFLLGPCITATGCALKAIAEERSVIEPLIALSLVDLRSSLLGEGAASFLGSLEACEISAETILNDAKRLSPEQRPSDAEGLREESKGLRGSSCDAAIQRLVRGSLAMVENNFADQEYQLTWMPFL